MRSSSGVLDYWSSQSRNSSWELQHSLLKSCKHSWLKLQSNQGQCVWIVLGDIGSVFGQRFKAKEKLRSDAKYDVFKRGLTHLLRECKLTLSWIQTKYMILRNLGLNYEDRWELISILDTNFSTKKGIKALNFSLDIETSPKEGLRFFTSAPYLALSRIS